MSRLLISCSFLVYCHLRCSLDGILLNLVKNPAFILRFYLSFIFYLAFIYCVLLFTNIIYHVMRTDTCNKPHTLGDAVTGRNRRKSDIDAQTCPDFRAFGRTRGAWICLPLGPYANSPLTKMQSICRDDTNANPA